MQISDFTLYQKNLLWTVAEPEAILADILDRNPDIVTLQEVSDQNQVVFDRLAVHYKDHHICYRSQIGVAVFSKWNAISDTKKCAPGTGNAAMKVSAAGKAVWLMSQHSAWPWPYTQPNIFPRLERNFPTMDAPVILAGDFNQVAWSDAIHKFENLFNANRIGKVFPTFSLIEGRFEIGIDHVLVGHGLTGHTELLPLLSSDHRGVFAHIRWQ